MTVKVANERGKIFYGMHFYPGVAEYAQAGSEPLRVYLNEDTIRAMDPSFAGCPVFVHHVDGVDSNKDALRKEADGWVIESFFNQSDGKHWVKFIVVSDRGELAIKQGMRLSNAYFLKGTGGGGVWNGVTYNKEVTDAKYEHLAIVPNPRYDESVIMTPEQFKAYNDDKYTELKRLANNADKKGKGMLSKLFKRAKVENADELKDVYITLPESKKEMTIDELAAAHDKHLMNDMAYGDHHVVCGDKKMTVNDMINKYNAACNELDALKAKDKEEEEGKKGDKKENDDKDGDDDDMKKKKNKNAADDKVENAEDVEAKKKAKEEADKLRNAEEAARGKDAQTLDLMVDKVQRGKAKYGSN